MHTYTPRGVCSRAISVELDGDRVSHVEFAGGCDGNLKAVSKLVRAAASPSKSRSARKTAEPMRSSW